MEDGISAAPYSLLGALEWTSVQGVSATLLVKQLTLDSVDAGGTAVMNAGGLATITLASASDDDVSFHATYMAVPVNKGADWALVRMDSGILGSARLIAR